MIATAPDSALRRCIIGGAFLVAYYLAALWSKELIVIGGASAWFPGAGLAFGLVLRYGLAFWPWLVVGEIISSQVALDLPYNVAEVAASVLLVTGAYLATAMLLRHLVRGKGSFTASRDLGLFALIGVVGASLLAALGGVAVLVWAGATGGSEFLETVRTFAVGDAIAIATLTPIICAVQPRVVGAEILAALRSSPRSSAVALIQWGLVLATPFLPIAFDEDRPALLALVLVPVTWVALTRSFQWTMVTAFVAIAMTTVAANIELGATVTLTDLQLFMVSVALIALAVSTVMERLRESEEILIAQAGNDPLTGLPNRKRFIEHIQELEAQGVDPVVVVFVDLDRFKLVNDTLGHDIGDSLLVLVAERLAQAGEADGAMVARFGGDEFTAVVPTARAGGFERGERLARELLGALRRPFQIGFSRLQIDASAGIAVGDPADPYLLLREADLALFDAKATPGRDIAVFDSRMGTRAHSRAQLEERLREAIDKQAFAVHFQPMVSLPDREVIGYEALLRLDVNGAAAITPADFIPVAEETGLIHPIGRWMIRRAMVTACSWHENGEAPRLWINLSPSELREEGTADHIEETLEQTGLPPESLGVELTESAALSDLDHTVALLERLRARGVQVALDDFGTGHSSLAHLRRLPIDIVKLDREFIGVADNNYELIAAVVAMARALDLEVVAEGVEHAEQLDALQRAGVHAAQGFLIGRPGPAPEAPGPSR